MNYYFVSIALLSGTLSALGTLALLPILRRHVMDVPNERSNHKTPVPRGGGIAMVAAALLGLALAKLPFQVIDAAILLACVSFVDDLKNLSVKIRLTAQCIAVALALSALPGRVFPAFVPHVIEWLALALAWIWFINLTNFMDGIDGISAMEAIMVAAGIALMHFMHPWLPPSLTVAASVMAASAYGFYLFNKHPALLFMGDVGSIPLGFLMGYLLLWLASCGYLLSALILPAYYVADATLTLIKRFNRGEKIFQAHSTHAYQQAVRGGLTHAQVVSRISWLNAALIGLAMLASLSMMAGVIAAIAAYGLTFWLIRRFTHAASA